MMSDLRRSKSVWTSLTVKRFYGTDKPAILVVGSWQEENTMGIFTQPLNQNQQPNQRRKDTNADGGDTDWEVDHNFYNSGKNDYDYDNYDNSNYDSYYDDGKDYYDDGGGD